MIIKSIKLNNFRNHSEYFLECKQDTSLILGKNGCGKTSVLEAIYILTRGKSEVFYRIELEFINGEKILATFDGKTKNFLILDKKTRRLPKNHKYPVILFLPTDLNLISHSPGRRRDYFDRIFSQFNESYAVSLSKYEKSLRQRNELLKNDPLSPTDVFSWDIMLAKYGTELYNLRKQYITEINQLLTKTYRSIAKTEDEIKIIYKTELDNINNDKYLKKLTENFQKDLYLGHTSFGVHRDDYIFEFNHKLANGSASRGESRSIILALKFIEANLIYEKLNKKPIILLDDVFSELDETRRKCLVENFKNNQVIITSVEYIE